MAKKTKELVRSTCDAALVRLRAAGVFQQYAEVA